MQLTLTASDLAVMPTALRQDLLAYLATRRKSSPPGAGRRRGEVVSEKPDGLAVLDSGQAIALIRNVSFGHKLKGLHDLLEALSYEGERDAPGPDRLARLLNVDDSGHLRRYFDAIKRLLKRVTHDAAPLARYSRQSGTYLVHPITRASLPGGVCPIGTLQRRRRAAVGMIPPPRLSLAGRTSVWGGAHRGDRSKSGWPPRPAGPARVSLLDQTALAASGEL